MRIRKRFLSLSAAITALPPSDSQLNNLEGPLPLPLSDHTVQIGLQTSSWASSGAGSEPKKLIVSPHKELEFEKKEIIKTNDTGRKESIVFAATSSRLNIASVPAPPTTAHLVLKGWLEGDRLIPVKKRRGSFRKGTKHDLEEYNEMIDQGTKKPKLKKNGRYVPTKEANATCPKSRKNGKRESVIMKGSRCSRVNGRGWRCWQQTLVGYSLCEHHLGKGRLRSMNSVRGRAQKVALKEQDKQVEMILMDHPDFDDAKHWEEESVSSIERTNKCTKKKKLGVVKARSLSSLLSDCSPN